MPVRWIDHAIPDPRPAPEATIRDYERRLRVPFPADYRAVATVRQGARPDPAGIALPGGFGTAVSHLFHFEEQPAFSNIVTAAFPFEGVLEKGWIPFAADIAGDVFCLDYRTDYDRPRVLFWGQGFGPLPLADSFTAWAGMLRAC